MAHVVIYNILETTLQYTQNFWLQKNHSSIYIQNVITQNFGLLYIRNFSYLF